MNHVRALLLSPILGAAMLAPQAAAHGPLPGSHAEADAVGPRLIAQERARHARLSPQARTQRRLRALRTPRTAPDPAVSGRWSGLRGLPSYAIHAALTHTGDVMLWGYSERGTIPGSPTRRRNEGEMVLWDTSRPLPSLRTARRRSAAFRSVPPPKIYVDADEDGEADDRVPTPIFCSGQSFLADGRVLVVGGTKAFNTADRNWEGLASILIFDPVTRTWTAPSGLTTLPRWYPTQAMLADGRTVILGGLDDSGKFPDQLVNEPEVLGTDGSLLRLPFTGVVPAIYPHTFATTDGGLVMRPGYGSTHRLDPSLNWTSNFSSDGGHGERRDWPNVVPLPAGPGQAPTRLLELGGYDGRFDQPAMTTTRTLDVSDPAKLLTEPWNPGPEMVRPRANANTVVLPDGTVVSVGGGAGYSSGGEALYWTNGDEDLKRVEILDPATGRWRLGAPQAQFRAYHSVALLLPDGRILSAGDDYHSDQVVTDAGSPWRGTAEIYSPPYLFAPGPRPVLKATPARVPYGDTFAVGTKADDVERVVLMMPSAVTHGNDMTQRRVELQTVRRPGRGVDVVAPSTPGVAPPGRYMLFGLSRTGKPSVARWIELRAGLPPAPEFAPVDAAAPAPAPAAPAAPATTATAPAATPVPATPAVEGASVTPAPQGVAVPAAQLAAPARARLGGAVAARVSCPDQACVASLAGTLRVPGARGTVRSLPLVPARRALARRRPATLAVRVPAAARAAARSALRHGRTVEVRLTLTARDGARHRSVHRATVRLQP